MIGGQIEAPRGWQADTGQGNRYAEAAGTPKITQPAASAKRTRPRGFAAWNPRPASLELVQDVQAVLADYAAHLPLTIRQVFYRLVSTRGFRKSETVNRARRARLIRFADIRDDGPSRYEPASWADAAGILRDAIEARRNPDTAARLLDRESDMRADLVARLGAEI